MTKVMVAVLPRDRLSETAQTVRSVLEVIPEPFRLVDAGSPRRYRLEVERELHGDSGAEILRSDGYMDANAANGCVVRDVADGGVLAFVEDDGIMRTGRLDRLIAANEPEAAGVACPVIFGRVILRSHPYFDQRPDRTERIEDAA